MASSSRYLWSLEDLGLEWRMRCIHCCCQATQNSASEPIWNAISIVVIVVVVLVVYLANNEKWQCIYIFGLWPLGSNPSSHPDSVRLSVARLSVGTDLSWVLGAAPSATSACMHKRVHLVQYLRLPGIPKHPCVCASGSVSLRCSIALHTKRW